MDGNLINLVEGYLIKLEIEYDQQKNLDFLLKDFNFKKNFTNKVEYLLNIPKISLSIFENRNINFSILETLYIETNKKE